MLCFAAKFLSLGVLAGRAAAGFEEGNASAVDAAAGGLGVANVVEPHKAPFAAGDAAALAGDYGTARTLFEQSLTMVPGGSGDECLVRVNLTLVIERLGDQRLQARDPASAASLFKEALTVAGQAPQYCLSADAEAGAAGRLNDAKGRLEGKLGATGQPAAQEAAPAKEPAPEGSSNARQSQPGPAAGQFPPGRTRAEQWAGAGRIPERDRRDRARAALVAGPPAKEILLPQETCCKTAS
ncbi:hypothetical protein NG819_12470 [Pseudarthrobacter sp. Fe7]|nr:hypothetical protein NG819_12470 [Pseudarthrobacter sp. Fe7]